MSIRLIEHRQALANNPNAYTYEIEHNIDRLVSTLIPHLRYSGIKLSLRKHSVALANIVTTLFDVQDKTPIFHVEGTELPLCWNSPGDWDKNYIKYEWGHLRSKNQNPTQTLGIEDLALYSARCNRHIQSSMNIEELMIYGGILEHRIRSVIAKRQSLFASNIWHDEIEKLREVKSN